MLTRPWAAVNVSGETVAACDGSGLAGFARLGQVAQRVHGAAVEDSHEMHVRAGRKPGHTDVADDLASGDGVADLHRRPDPVVEVAVEGREVAEMRDDHDDGGIAIGEI